MVAVTRAIGRKAAMEMLLKGRFFSGAEAKDLGLVNRVVATEQLAAETEQLANQIAEASRFVLAGGKQGFYAQADQTDNNAMHYAKHAITMNLEAVDAQNGIQAFLNKEKPTWQNGYSRCQKDVPIAERFFATTLMPPSFFRNILMTSGIKCSCRLWRFNLPDKSVWAYGFFPIFPLKFWRACICHVIFAEHHIEQWALMARVGGGRQS
ncbi:MAG: enoyl-CoA hydratase-related protein [Desulfobacterales bacterium]|jgi:hypothetical protein